MFRGPAPVRWPVVAWWWVRRFGRAEAGRCSAEIPPAPARARAGGGPARRSDGQPAGSLPNVPDVFAEFCAAGLWPGVGPGLIKQFDAAGIRSPADVTATKLAALPRMTDRRANRLLTGFIGAGQLYDIAELLVPVE